MSVDSGAGTHPLPTSPLHEVRMLQIPIPLHARAQEHNAELLREMYLLAQQVKESGSQQLPVRLVALVDALGTQFAGLTTIQDQQLDDAVAANVAEIDVIYHIPREAAVASRLINDMLDEADQFCRDGHHLLTLATPDDLLRYRRWFLGEFVDQVDGAAPTPWPDYESRA
jgi:hypothetical protein